MSHWLKEHEELILWLFGLSVATVVAAISLLPVLLARMPEDYFVREGPPPESWRGRHPAVRLALRVAKNALGVALVLIGIPLVPLPGQGIVTILLGLALVDFPGKRRLELRIVRIPGVLRAVNWMRRRAHRPPLRVDGVGPGEGTRDPAQPRA
ncbi:MAG TPA: PGPGW domain-containing protein [Planctomycetota bacterium]|nr:PGPGW domain-containing protein [Planctomycetota bacterium]